MHYRYKPTVGMLSEELAMETGPRCVSCSRLIEAYDLAITNFLDADLDGERERAKTRADQIRVSLRNHIEQEHGIKTWLSA